MWATHVLLALTLLAACGEDNGGLQPGPDMGSEVQVDAPGLDQLEPEWVPALPDRDSPGFAFHEHTLGDELGGSLLNSDDTVVAHLEHPSKGLSGPKDLGDEIGVDDFQYEHFETSEHTFCWEGDPDGEPHFMTLHDESGTELLRVEEGGECKTLRMEPGRYTKRLHHSGRGDEEGHTVFMGPAQEGAPRILRRPQTESAGLALGATASAQCKQIKTINYSDMAQLKAGEVGFANSCTASSTLQLAVFNAECPDVQNSLGALFASGGETTDPNPSGDDDMDCCWLNWYALKVSSNLEAVVPGPSTSVVMFQGGGFSGRSATFAAPQQLNCINPSVTLGAADAHHDAKRSFKVFTSFLNANDGGCSVTWSGLASQLFTDPNTWAGPAEGEAYLFTDLGFAGEAFKFTGPCYDLGSLCALNSISSIAIGPKTVVYLYKGVGFLGENFPYKTKTANLDDYSDMVQSLFLEPLTVYNNNTTLIKTKNCDNCTLTGLKLTEGESLQGVSLVSANLKGAQLNGVDLSGSTLTNTNFTNALLVGADMQGVVATGAIFRGAQMAYVNLKGATLTNAVFESDGTILAANLAYAYMPNAKLDGAHLTKVILAYAQIYGAQATVEKAYMDGIILSNAILANMNFKQASMKGAEMTGAVLMSANLSGTDLTGATLINASLQGADFSNALLYQAKLQNAAVASAPGSIQVTRLGDNNTLVTAQASYNATILPKETTDKDTYCPNGAISFDGNAYCDSAAELTAPSPPSPPTCVPSLTNFCPKAKK